MTNISASEFFGGKPTQVQSSTTPIAKPRKKGVGERIMDTAAAVTDTLGLRRASDAIANDLAPAALATDRSIHNKLAAQNYLKPQSLKENIIGGAELGLATAGGEFSSAAAATARAGARAGVRLAGRGVEATGQKIQQSVIRPAIADIKDGFKIENVAKYDVGGSLPQTIAKVQVKMNDLGKELAAKLKASDTKINLHETLAETAKRLADDKAGSFGDNGALDRVLEQIDGEIKHMGGHEHDLVSATNIKRAAGTKGAWAYNRPEADANAIERAYTTFYGVLKEQIEKAAPPGVKDINKKLSDLITIQNAALRRLPVEQRNNVFSLTDSIGFLSSVFDPRALLLVGATKAAKSGKVGNVLVKAGRAMQGKK
jgi:hypothetical protein